MKRAESYKRGAPFFQADISGNDIRLIFQNQNSANFGINNRLYSFNAYVSLMPAM